MTLRFPAVLLVLIISAATAPADVLSVGDPAPELKVKEFVKGEPIKGFEKGKIYVVEFWATWCGPCRQTIPHLTKLQKKYKDVTFIGVSVSEDNQADVEPFVKEMGDKMDYRVAMDLVPEGKEADEGAMYKNWLEAAETTGLPTAFIVEGSGKIAWIGDAKVIEKPLEKVVSGKFDLKTAAIEYKKANHRQALLGQMRKAMKAGDTKGALEQIEKAIMDDPDLESEKTIALIKFDLLRSKGGDLDKAAAYGQKLVSTTFKDDADALNDFAWDLCNPDEKDIGPKLAACALEAAQKANKIAGGKKIAILVTLARANFLNGEIDKAIEVQRRTVTLAETAAEVRKLKTQLDEYRSARKKKDQ